MDGLASASGLFSWNQSAGDADSIPQIHGGNRHCQVSELRVGELTAGGVVRGVGDMSMSQIRHRFRPSEGRPFTLREAGRFPPTHQARHFLFRSAARAGIFPMRIRTVRASVDLRDARVNQIQQRQLDAAVMQTLIKLKQRLIALGRLLAHTESLFQLFSPSDRLYIRAAALPWRL